MSSKFDKAIGAGVPGHVGIELEYEFRGLTEALRGWKTNKYWNAVAEGSLRNGQEFVLHHPLEISELPGAFRILHDMVDTSRIVDSIRTSTHIHVNASTLTYRDIFYFLLLYWGIENVLVKMNGTNREGNLFCLRSSDAEIIIHDVIREMSSPRGFSFRSFQKYKYSALNLYPVYRQGSVEFRFLRMLIDPEVIISWSDNLYRLTHSGKMFDLPMNVLLKELLHNPRDIYRQIFTNAFYRQLDAFDLREEIARMESVLRYYCSTFTKEDAALPRKEYVFSELVFDAPTLDLPLGEDR